MLCLAYSQIPPPAPRIATITAMIRVIITVPKIAGKIPPSVFASRGSWLRNSQMLLKYMASFCQLFMAFAG